MPKIMGVNIPSTYEGTCDSGMVASTTAIVSSELVNYGNDFFNNKYYMQVILNSNSAGNAPEREVRQITDYVSATGTFTCAAFTANVEASDELLVIHESLIAPTADVATDTLIGHSIGKKTDAAVTTVGVVASIIAYVKGILNRIGTPAGASVSADIVVIDGYHDVPTADATTDTVMRDVIGRKTDAAVTTVGVVASIIAYVKGILNRIGTPAGASIAADIVVVDGYHDVPTADATTDAVMRDVVGRKTDAAVTTVGVVASIIAYIKGILNRIGTPASSISADIAVIDGYHDVPTADAATDAVMRDVVGRKTDTANTTVGTGSSLMRYIKGILNTVLTLATPTNITAGTITTVTNLTNAPTAGDLTATMKTSVNTEVDTALNTAVPNTPTGSSLNDILSKLDGANTYDNTTDSLEAIRDKIDTLPTAGAVVSTASATTTGVIVEDGTTGTPSIVEPSSSATANTFGSWTELDASVSAISYISSLTIVPRNLGVVEQRICVEIGTGGAGSEATKIRFSYAIERPSSVNSIHPSRIFILPIPIKVASGTRIAVRVSDSEAVANAYYISAQYYQSLET